MSRVILDIKNNEKGRYLLDFLKQIDFLEIKEDADGPEGDKKEIEEVLLNAPTLTEEEIKNIEDVGKEFRKASFHSNIFSAKSIYSVLTRKRILVAPFSSPLP